MKRLYDFVSFDKSVKTLTKNTDDLENQVEELAAKEEKHSKSNKPEARFARFLRKIDTKNELYANMILNAEVVDRPKLNQLMVNIRSFLGLLTEVRFLRN